uniref:Secreted protein n=1 Tax=Electrophorus electricus TaxID=8005 RepID=A0AAY5EG33_ELEEL
MQAILSPTLSLNLFFSVSLHQTMQAARCPTDELSLTNCAVVSEKDLKGSGEHCITQSMKPHPSTTILLNSALLVFVMLIPWQLNC